MLHKDLPIYKKGYNLLSLAADVQLNMPRTFKQSLGKRVHDECVEMLLEIGYANASRGDQRCDYIRSVSRRLEEMLRRYTHMNGKGDRLAGWRWLDVAIAWQPKKNPSAP